MLEYKAEWYGNDIIKVPTMYPSSQTYSCCGYRNLLVKNITIRKWECPECHATHDRNTNASINIISLNADKYRRAYGNLRLWRPCKTKALVAQCSGRWSKNPMTLVVCGVSTFYYWNYFAYHLNLSFYYYNYFIYSTLHFSCYYFF